MRAARDLYDFDDVFTAPLHGFGGADDYYARGSAKPQLDAHPHSGAGAERAQRPVRAGVGAAAAATRSAPCVTLWQPAHGGHVGFAGGALARPRARRCPSSVAGWLGRAPLSAAARAQSAAWTRSSPRR